MTASGLALLRAGGSVPETIRDRAAAAHPGNTRAPAVKLLRSSRATRVCRAAGLSASVAGGPRRVGPERAGPRSTIAPTPAIEPDVSPSEPLFRRTRPGIELLPERFSLPRHRHL